MSFRCVVFAAVSSAPQALDDKGSIPSQVANAQAVIQRRGWIEVLPPLIVPGQSRSIDFLHEAIEEVTQLGELTNAAKHNKIDLVICRDYDRLARTRTLLTQLSSYLSHCGVQIYAIDKPVEPVPVENLKRKRGLYSSATVEAFAGLEAEREVARIVERRHFGINNVMRQGKWHQSYIAYGYTREAAINGVSIMLDVPEIVEEESVVIKRIEQDFLAGASCGEIVRHLTAEHIGRAAGKTWGVSTVHYILRNPFYCGYIVWGLRRNQTVYDPKKDTFVRKRAWVASYEKLCESLGRKPGIQDLIDHKEMLAADEVVIVKGQHQPIRDMETQLKIDSELQTRVSLGGRAVSLKNKSGNSRLFSGIIHCNECGSPMVVHKARKKAPVYYRCNKRRIYKSCDNSHYVPELSLYEQVSVILKEIAYTPGAIDAYISHQDNSKEEYLHVEKANLESALSKVDNRTQRWDAAYEAGVIDLTAYGQRVSNVAEEKAELLSRLQLVNAKIEKLTKSEQRKKDILEALKNPPPISDFAAIKVHLRRVIKDIKVFNNKIIELELRL